MKVLTHIFLFDTFFNGKIKHDEINKNCYRQIKLGEAFQDYVNTRKSLKPETLRSYHRVMNFAFKDWKTKPLLSISKDKIAKHHSLLGTQHGKAYANLAMRLLRAIFNFAAGQYESA